MNTPPPDIVPGLSRFCADFLIPIFLGFFAFACAGQVGPSGGPVDKVPPEIVRTEPDTNALHVRTNVVVLEFSKYVDRRSVEESVFISPYVGELEYEWSGTEVQIHFPDSLRRNTTYVVNVGTDVADTRAGNRMASGFTLAFSTGDSIDQGFISGRVFDEKPEGVMIFAYSLRGIERDTLNPMHTKPDYIMQTGKGGFWTLSNIAFGLYRVVAVRDEYRNLVYDKGIDAFGTTTGDIAVDALRPRISHVDFRLTKEDTVRPFLSSVKAVNRTMLQLRFSEALDSLKFQNASFSIVDTVTRKAIEPKLWWLTRSVAGGAGVLLATPVDSGAPYRIEVRGVQDLAGNSIDTTHASLDFSGTGRPDTLRPVMNLPGLRDSVRSVWVHDPVEIDFSKPVVQEPLREAVALLDSSGKGVDMLQRWLSATDLLLVPRRDFLSKAWYQIRVKMDSVRDYFGNRCKDSTFILHFQTFDLRSTGVIAGSVVDPHADSLRGELVLTATSIDLSPQRKQSVRMARPGPFLMSRLVEGKYVLDVFCDRDSSGSYSFGSLSPFVPSEPFAVYPDTVRVRARWNVEGVQLRLP